MSTMTETQYAVDDMRVAQCATCVLLDYNNQPCRHLRSYRLYRDVPAEWVFAATETLTCADWFAKPPHQN